MRKLIIDTDTGSDDAVALMMALRDPNVQVLGLTTVSGNVPLELATKNALMTAEVCGSDVPLYTGADRPLCRELVTAVNVHGNDGMGDCGLVHPQRQPDGDNAVDFILNTVRAAPGEIELVTLGPVTNIALAILKDPKTMRGVKRIWSMATAGFGPGNTTAVAEFNVYVDAEAFAIMLGAGIPITIAGFDLCIGAAALLPDELDAIKNSGSVGKFAIECNASLLQYNIRRGAGSFVDLPDPVTMACVLWDEVVTGSVDAYCYCCTKEEPAYGQVIVCPESFRGALGIDPPPANTTVVSGVDGAAFKRRLAQVLSE